MTPVDSRLPADPDSVLVAGDWHGNLPWAKKIITYAAERGAPVILHVGDFGYWVPSPATTAYLDGVQGALRRAGITLAFADGNHEFHPHLDNDLGTAAYPLPDLPNIWHLPRGFRWSWWGKTWMALGGAHSVDRGQRTAGVDWWSEEHLTDEQVAYAGRYGGVDVVIAHDAPEGVAIPGVRPATDPQAGWPLLELLAAEQHRTLVRQVFDAVTPSLWVHGHYHVGYQAQFRGCRVVGLDRDGTRHLGGHVLVLSREGQA